MNQTKLNLHLLPDEKVLSRPPGLPTLPLQNEQDYSRTEKYMKENEDAVAATVSHIIHYYPNFPLFILECGCR